MGPITLYISIAQLKEQLSSKQKVAGLSPAGDTIIRGNSSNGRAANC